MRINKMKVLEKLKNILFHFIYLIILIVLLAFILNREEKNKSASQILTEKEQSSKENGK
jgi:hypothetical protein